mmetsp:Transcript_13186/g.14811  ORF Transcript_13186/g.14811 Transcript_13186/m.14811 type:complete len:97 (-) Transcript_13186:178-468(-)
MNYNLELTIAENLSEEFLSENAISSKVLSCPRLSKNMSSTPFKTDKNALINTNALHKTNTLCIGSRFSIKALKPQICTRSSKLRMSSSNQINMRNI